MLRKSTSERIKIAIKTSVGTLVTGLVPADFKGGNIFLYKADGSKVTVTLTAAVNFFESDSTDAPGIYEFILTTSHTDTLGPLYISFQPQAMSFSPTYFFDTVEDSLATISSDLSDIKGAGWTNADNLHNIQIKTTNIPASPASTTDITNARDSIKGTSNYDLTQIAGGALFDSMQDNLHSIKQTILAIPINIASATWDEAMTLHNNAGTMGELMNLMSAISNNRVKIDRTTHSLKLYAADNVTVLKTYNLYDITGQAADVLASERMKGV